MRNDLSLPAVAHVFYKACCINDVSRGSKSQLLTPGCPALGFHAVIAQDTYYLKIHVQIHQINVGIWYKNPIHYQARAIKYVLNHGNPGSFLGPIQVYLLCSFFDARRTFMGIKYILPSL
jgi:hypothetical protein